MAPRDPQVACASSPQNARPPDEEDRQPSNLRGTTLVPTATSNASRLSTMVDDMDMSDAHGRIYMSFRSAGGRKVASSNLAAPIG
jgi:hypothetical protein